MPGFQFINSGGAPGASVGVGISTIVGPTGPAGGVSFATPVNSANFAPITGGAWGGMFARVTPGYITTGAGYPNFQYTKGEAIVAGNINNPDSQDIFATYGAANTGGNFAGAYNYTGTYVQWGSIGKALISLAFGKMMEDRLYTNPLSAEIFNQNTTVSTLLPQYNGTAVVLTNVTPTLASGPNQWIIASTGSQSLSALTVQNLLQFNFGSFLTTVGASAVSDTYHPTFGYALGDSLGGVSNMVAQGRAADVYVDNAELYYSSFSADYLSTGLANGYLSQNPNSGNAIQEGLGWAVWGDNLTGAGYFNDAVSSTGGGLYAENNRVINNTKGASGAYVPLSFASRGSTDFFSTGANRNPYGVLQTYGRYNFTTFNLLAQVLDRVARINGTTLIAYIRNKFLTPLGMTKTYFSVGEAGPADLQANKVHMAWSRTNLEIYMQTGFFNSSFVPANAAVVSGLGLRLGVSPLNYGCSTGYNAAWTRNLVLGASAMPPELSGAGIDQVLLMLGPLVTSFSYPDDGQSRLYNFLTRGDSVFPNQVFGEAPVYGPLSDLVKLIKCLMKYGKVGNTQVLTPMLVNWFWHPKSSANFGLTTIGGATDDGAFRTWCGAFNKYNNEVDVDCKYENSEDTFTQGSAFGSSIRMNLKTGYWWIWQNGVSGICTQQAPLASIPSLFDPFRTTYPYLVDNDA